MNGPKRSWRLTYSLAVRQRVPLPSQMSTLPQDMPEEISDHGHARRPNCFFFLVSQQQITNLESHVEQWRYWAGPGPGKEMAFCPSDYILSWASDTHIVVPPLPIFLKEKSSAMGGGQRE
jgi:hypothetical protein